jgi:hypothetical protein
MIFFFKNHQYFYISYIIVDLLQVIFERDCQTSFLIMCNMSLMILLKNFFIAQLYST